MAGSRTARFVEPGRGGSHEVFHGAAAIQLRDAGPAHGVALGSGAGRLRSHHPVRAPLTPGADPARFPLRSAQFVKRSWVARVLRFDRNRSDPYYLPRPTDDQDAKEAADG